MDQDSKPTLLSRIIMGIGASFAAFVLMMPFGKFFSGDDPSNAFRIKIGWGILILFFLAGFLFPKIGSQLFRRSAWGAKFPSSSITSMSDEQASQKVKIRYFWLVISLFLAFILFIFFDIKCNGISNCFN